MVKALEHLLLQAVRGPRDHEVSQGGPPPFAEPVVLFEELTVLRYCVLEFLDAFTCIAAGHHDGRKPRVGVELMSDLQYGTHLRGGVLCLRVIRFVDAEDVSYLHDTSLERLHRVPRTRLQAKHHRISSRGDLDLSLPDPDG